MIGRIWAIAVNTFREAIRNKVLYGVLGVVVAANLFAIVLGAMSLREEARIARDVGLAGVSIFGSFTAIALGVSLLYAEVQKRTIHVILARPIARWEFVLGKYLGMALTLTLLVAAFALAMAGVLALTDLRFDAILLRAVVLGWFEVLVVAAIAIFFSSFTSPFLSGVFTLGLFVIGRSWAELAWAAERAREAWIRVVARAALHVVPDLHVFGISGGQVEGQAVSVHATFVGWSYVGAAAGYALATIAILLALAMVVFARRDFA